jgi:dihydroorotase
MNAQRIIIKKGLDAHCHFRQSEMLCATAPFTAQRFSRAVAMPNTIPPIAAADDAEKYRDEIKTACGAGFEPIMAIMLTKKTTPKIVKEAGRRGVKVLKYIPQGVSTNSDESVALEELSDFYPVLDAARQSEMIFSGHWESLYNSAAFELPEIRRESAAVCFLDRVIRHFPKLKIVVEHASTKDMIEYVAHCPKNVRATLTVHHAMLTHSRVCDEKGRIHAPHHYCKPIAKNIWDVAAVVKAMTSGDPRFFFGSDNAPHPKAAKEKVPPAAGISNPFTVEWLYQIFKFYGATDKLNGFLTAGEEFYGLTPGSKTIELVERDHIVPAEIKGIIPFMSGQTLHCQIAD